MEHPIKVLKAELEKVEAELLKLQRQGLDLVNFDIKDLQKKVEKAMEEFNKTKKNAAIEKYASLTKQIDDYYKLHQKFYSSATQKRRYDLESKAKDLRQALKMLKRWDYYYDDDVI